MPSLSKREVRRRKRAQQKGQEALSQIFSIISAIEPEESLDQLWKIFELAMISQGRETVKHQELADDFFWYSRMKELIIACGDLTGLKSMPEHH